jgi:CBS domain-containing protein
MPVLALADAPTIASPLPYARARPATPLSARLTFYRMGTMTQEEALMTIRHLLKSKGSYVPSIGSDATVRHVLEQLDLDDAGALVVTDDEEKILGIISERDVVRALKTQGLSALDQPARALMPNVVRTCDINEPISRVLELMDKHQFRHVPITSNNRLCGIIHMLDVVKYRLGEIRAEADALKAYAAGVA